MNEYAIHCCVFNNDFEKLKSLLIQSKVREKMFLKFVKDSFYEYLFF